MKATPRGHERAADKATMTISCPKILKDRIKELAKMESRTISNWVVFELEKMVERRLNSPPPKNLLHSLNEPEGHYGAVTKKKAEGGK